MPARTAPLTATASSFVFGPPAPRTVPERVKSAIAREQDSSEILVTLIQFGAVLTFATLYHLAPKAFPPDVPFEPVPWALGFYTAFTAFRFWLALRRRLSRWFLALSVLVDVALLMTTIWSFHLQYQEPAALYLKAPTLMYAFILIALRALRFQPSLVVLCGAASGAGWLALVAYAVFWHEEPMLTRSYVEYMTSYKILLGAEFDKIVSLGMVTAILAVALVRSRKLLIRAVSDQMAAAELSRFFAPEVAGRIRESDSAIRAGEAEMRDAAIMFVDLRGFTPLSQSLEPNEVMHLLAEYQRRVVPVIRRHGGSIDKFLGDGILASFGASAPSDSYAADGLRAMDELVGTAAGWAGERRMAGLPAPAVGIAVATGPVMFGAIGDEDRLEYTVIGDAVNLAAKLEKHTKAEGVRAICPVDALERATAQGFDAGSKLRRLDARSVEGVESPLDIAVIA